MSYAATDMDRRLGNLLSIGRISAVDPSRGMAQVDMDGVITDWIPWTAKQAGGNRSWACPDVGEQVLVAAPSGELADAVIIGSLFQDSSPEPASSGDVTRTVYEDGTVVEYDRAANQFTLDTSASSGKVVVICERATVQGAERVVLDTPEAECTGNLTVAGNFTMGGSGSTATITGNVAINGGSLTHNGKNVGSTHTHSGVQSGGSSTGEPN